jgi:hypothetical protein
MSQVKNTLNDRPTTFKRMVSTFSVASSDNSKEISRDSASANHSLIYNFLKGNNRLPFIQVFAVNLRHLVSSMRTDAKYALQSDVSDGTSPSHLNGASSNGLKMDEHNITDLVPDDMQMVDWQAAKDSERAQLYEAIVSALMSWGIEEKLEQTCIERLRLQRLGSEVTIGLRGYCIRQVNCLAEYKTNWQDF